jgi:peroxiredoxin
MRTLGFALGALTLVAFGGTSFAEGPLALGARAPLADTKMKSATDGKEVTLAKVAGKKGTLAVFTCNGCPYAKAWEQRIVALGNDYAKKGVGVVLINSNSPAVSKGDAFEEMQKRAKERGMSVPYAVDEGSLVARAFGATKTPEAFLFDKDGKLVYHGTIDDNHEQADKVQKKYLQDALEAVVNGKAVPQGETKSIGCSIKFPKVS